MTQQQIDQIKRRGEREALECDIRSLECRRVDMDLGTFDALNTRIKICEDIIALCKARQELMSP